MTVGNMLGDSGHIPEPTEAEILGMAEDYGQWMWDAGYLDDPRGESLAGKAAFKREEIKQALVRLTNHVYAEGRADEGNENGTASRLIDAWVHGHGKQIPWAKAVQIVAIVNKMPATELARLLALGEAE